LDIKKNDRPDVAPQHTCFCKINDSFFFQQPPSHQATMTAPTTSNHNTATAANTTTTPIRALHQLTLICDFGQNMQLPRLQHEGQLFN
jgi:hypothetical protein